MAGIESGQVLHYKEGYNMDLAPFGFFPCRTSTNSQAVMPLIVADGGGECTGMPSVPEHGSKCGLDACDGQSKRIISGYICPQMCKTGFYPFGQSKCVNGQWTKMQCLPRTSVCQVPTLGKITGVYGPGCGRFTQTGTKCQFNCKSGSFGWGEMKCIGKGLAKDLVADGDHTKLFKEWEFADAGSGCISASEDNLYGAPVDLEAKQDALAVVVSLKMPTTNLRNDASWDKKKRSMAQKYAFKVEPSGELACPDSPIKDSVICFGGKFGGEYNISAVIVSGKGTGPSTSPVSVKMSACAEPLPHQYVTKVCDAATLSQTQFAFAKTCGGEEYRSKVHEKGSSSALGKDGECTTCTPIPEAHYQSTACKKGDFTTMGSDGMATKFSFADGKSDCSPPAGKFLLQAPQVGNLFNVGEEPVYGDCKDPPAHNYVTGICVAGILNCKMKNTACGKIWDFSLGKNTQWAPCSTVGPQTRSTEFTDSMALLCKSCNYYGTTKRNRETRVGMKWTLEKCKQACKDDPKCFAIDYAERMYNSKHPYYQGWCYHNWEGTGRPDVYYRTHPYFDVYIKYGANHAQGSLVTKTCDGGDWKTLGTNTVMEHTCGEGKPARKKDENFLKAIIVPGTDDKLGVDGLYEACNKGGTFQYFDALCGGLVLPPTNVKVGSVAESSASLSWDVPSANGGDISDYVVKFRPTKAKDPGPWNELSSRQPKQNTYKVTELAPNTEYDVLVSAKNQNGRGEWSAEAKIKTSGKSGPAAPTQLKVAKSADSCMDLTWSSSSAEVGHWAVQFRPTQSFEVTSGKYNGLNAGLLPEGGFLARKLVSGYDLTGVWLDSKTKSYVVIGPTADGYKGVLLQDESLSGGYPGADGYKPSTAKNALKKGDLLFHTDQSDTEAPENSYGIQLMSSANKQEAGAHRLEVINATFIKVFTSGTDVGGKLLRTITLESDYLIVQNSANINVAKEIFELTGSEVKFSWNALSSQAAAFVGSVGTPNGGDKTSRNCAVFRTATSSTESVGFGPHQAIDRLITSANSYCSDPTDTKPWLAIQLGESTTISHVAIAWAGEDHTKLSKHCKSGSISVGGFTKLFTKKEKKAYTIVTFDTPATGSEVKLQCNDVEGSKEMCIREFQAFGSTCKRVQRAFSSTKLTGQYHSGTKHLSTIDITGIVGEEKIEGLCKKRCLSTPWCVAISVPLKLKSKVALPCNLHETPTFIGDPKKPLYTASPVYSSYIIDVAKPKPEQQAAPATEPVSPFLRINTPDATAAFRIEGLTAATNYDVRVAPVSKTGQLGEYSSVIIGWTLGQAGPGAPQNIRVVKGTATSAELIWDPPEYDTKRYVFPEAKTLVRTFHIETRLFGSQGPWSRIDINSNTPTFSYEGLTPETLYEFQVAAVHPTWGRGRFCQPSALYMTDSLNKPDVPDSTKIVVNTAKPAGAPMDWVAPSDNGAAMTSYDVQYQRVGPGTPPNLKISATSSTSADLTWEVPIDNGSPITEYVIQYGPSESGELGKAAVFDSVISTRNPVSSAIVVGLATKTAYEFMICATNEVADKHMALHACVSGSSAAAAETTGVANTKVPSISKLETQMKVIFSASKSEISSPHKAIKLSFSGGDVTGGAYQIRYKPTKGGARGEWLELDTLSRTTLYILRGLASATEYDLSVRGCNKDGCSVYSETKRTTTEGTLGPDSTSMLLKVDAVSKSTAVLSWNKPSGAVGAYEVLYKPITPGATWTVLATGSPKESFTVPFLSCATEYDFRVRAINGNGVSTFTNPPTRSKTGGSKGEDPPTVSMGECTQMDCSLSWSALPGVSTYVLRYERASTGVSRYELPDYIEIKKTSVTIRDLSSKTTYNFQVAAKKDGCIGDFSGAKQGDTTKALGPNEPGDIYRCQAKYAVEPYMMDEPINMKRYRLGWDPGIYRTWKRQGGQAASELIFDTTRPVTFGEPGLDEITVELPYREEIAWPKDRWVRLIRDWPIRMSSMYLGGGKGRPAVGRKSWDGRITYGKNFHPIIQRGMFLEGSGDWSVDFRYEATNIYIKVLWPETSGATELQLFGKGFSYWDFSWYYITTKKGVQYHDMLVDLFKSPVSKKTTKPFTVKKEDCFGHEGKKYFIVSLLGFDWSALYADFGLAWQLPGMKEPVGVPYSSMGPPNAKIYGGEDTKPKDVEVIFDVNPFSAYCPRAYWGGCNSHPSKDGFQSGLKCPGTVNGVSKTPTHAYQCTPGYNNPANTVAIFDADGKDVNYKNAYFQQVDRGLHPLVHDISACVSVYNFEMRTTDTTKSSISVSWVPLKKAVDYALQYKVRGSSGLWSTIRSGSETPKFTVLELPAQTDYVFRVAGVDSAGNVGIYSSPLLHASTADVVGPQAPRSVIATGVYQTPRTNVGVDPVDLPPTVKLQWKAPLDNGADIVDYLIRYRQPPSLEWDQVRVGTAATEVNTPSQYLSTGIEYEFIVAAINANGIGKGSEPVRGTSSMKSGKVPKKPVISKSPAADITSNSVRVSWAKVVDNGAPVLSYTIRHKLAGSNEQWVYEEFCATPTSKFLLGDLGTGMTYKVQIAALNKHGLSEYSDSTSSSQYFTSAIVATGLVQIVDLTVEAHKVTPSSLSLVWSRSKGATMYTIKYRPAYSTDSFAIVKSPRNKITIPDLASAQRYEIFVAPANKFGSASFSSPPVISATTGTSGPQAPVWSSVSAPEKPSSVSLQWSCIPSVPQCPSVLQWAIRFRVYNSGDTWVVRILVAADMSVKTSTTFSGLYSGTEYEFQIAAKDTNGWSVFRSPLSVKMDKIGKTTGTAPVVAPRSLSVTGHDANSVSLIWDFSLPNIIGEYLIFYKRLGSSDTPIAFRTNGAPLVKSGHVPMRATIINLAADTDYEFKVSAVKTDGSGGRFSALVPGSTSTSTAGMPGPEAPTALTAVVTNSKVDFEKNGATLTWTAPADNGAAILRYNIFYQEEDDAISKGEWSLVQTRGTATKFTVRLLTANMNYRFAVAAVNTNGMGLKSKAVLLPWGPAALMSTNGGSDKPLLRLKIEKAITAAICDPRSANCIKLSYTPPKDVKSAKHIVKYRQAGSGGQWVFLEAANEGGADQWVHSIKYLSPSTAYDFRVAACDSLAPTEANAVWGCGPFTNPAWGKSFTTSQASSLFTGYNEAFWLQSGNGKDFMPAQIYGIRATPLKASTVSLTWDEPIPDRLCTIDAESNTPCPGHSIVYYIVRFREAQSSLPFVTYKTRVASAVISDLKPAIDYEFQVAAVNSNFKGSASELLEPHGVFSNPMTIASDGGSTSFKEGYVPTITTVHAAEHNAIDIAWKLPDGKADGYVTGYVLQWRPVGLDDNWERAMLKGSSVVRHKANWLSSGTDYEFRAAGMHNDMVGPFSEIFADSQTKTTELIITANKGMRLNKPTATISVIGQDFDSLTLSVDPIPGFVSGSMYLIQYKVADSVQPWNNFWTFDTSTEISGLASNTEYEVRYAASQAVLGVEKDKKSGIDNNWPDELFDNTRYHSRQKHNRPPNWTDSQDLNIAFRP